MGNEGSEGTGLNGCWMRGQQYNPKDEWADVIITERTLYHTDLI